MVLQYVLSQMHASGMLKATILKAYMSALVGLGQTSDNDIDAASDIW